LDGWIGKCPLYYIRRCAGRPVEMEYTLAEYMDKEHELVAHEVQAL
jgi:hypothetical protein